MRRIVSLAAWWAAFVLLWMAFVGTTTRPEVRAGLGAAAVAVAAVEVARAQGLLHFRVDRRWLARSWSSPAEIVYDFALLTSLLFRRGRVEGEYLAVHFPKGSTARRTCSARTGPPRS